MKLLIMYLQFILSIAFYYIILYIKHLFSVVLLFICLKLEETSNYISRHANNSPQLHVFVQQACKVWHVTEHRTSYNNQQIR